MVWSARICHDCVTASCQECQILSFRLHRAISAGRYGNMRSMGQETNNHKGAVAEAKIAAAAIEVGIPVLKPISEHGRYDLAFDLGERLLRVQCKWANRKADVVSVYVGGSYLSANGYVRSTYAADEVDAVAAYCGDLDECYLLPVELVAGQYGVHLRLAPARNGPAGRTTLCEAISLLWGCSSAGRAPPWHGGGHGFEPRQLHSSHDARRRGRRRS